MRPININTLFADIIDTPEQRQQKLLQQGMTQGRLLSSNLTGLARAAAPLAQMAGQLGVQRNEDLRRAVQPMLGIDPRTTGEKLQEALSKVNTSTPAGMLQAANMVQSIDPLRAATLRQEAARLRTEAEDRDLTRRTQEASLRASGLQEASAALQISERGQAVIDAQNYRENLPTLADAVRKLGTEYEAIATGIESGVLDPKDGMRDVASIQSAQFRATPKSEFKPISTGEKDSYLALARERPELEKLLKKGFLGRAADVSEERFLELAGKFRSMPDNVNKTPSEIIDLVQASITTGTGADLLEVDVEEMAQDIAGESSLNDNPEAAEAAAQAAAAQLAGAAPASLQFPDTISKEDAAKLDEVPVGYTQMSSGLLKLTNLNAAEQNVTDQNNAAIQKLVVEEYARIKPKGSAFDSAAMSQARQNVMARQQ
tara:strand:- start:10870 stop:12159 length:1290 start_codon:yes stop_codon:yes gene_type:complete